LLFHSRSIDGQTGCNLVGDVIRESQC
jgi:hypothetical protein